MKLKKFAALLLALVMVGILCGCGSEEGGDGGEVGVANPIHECTQEEMEETTGISLAAPEDAEDVSYSYIDGTDAEGEASPVAQVVFTLGDKEYTYRAMDSALTTLGNSDEESDLEALQEGLDSAIEEAQVLSGIYNEGEWSVAAFTVVADRDAVCAINESGDGFLSWLDVVPGVLYSISSGDAEQTDLEKMAEAIFDPMQGEN